MIKRKPSMIAVADETSINFMMLMNDGSTKPLASQPLEEFLDGGAGDGGLPDAVLQSVNRMLVIPDYWMGNRHQEFQASKPSVVGAFIDRTLKIEHPSLDEISDFYSYTIVKGQSQGQYLYTFYLQEEIAYRLYHRLKALDISPIRITTPALIWQARLKYIGHETCDEGVGLIHLLEEECFLYFFFLGQFLFSRHIPLLETGSEEDDAYSRLNYEINQSFYLYSQKTKRSVDALYMLAPESAATDQLADLLGREIQMLPCGDHEAGALEKIEALPACRNFSDRDLNAPGEHTISHKPLKLELAWRPVQWAGIAIGLLLTVLLLFESGALYAWSGKIQEQLREIASAAEEPPDLVLADVSQSLDTITQTLAQPSGSGTFLKTLLAMPEGVSIKKIALDLSPVPHLNIDAVVTANDPDAFQVTLGSFLGRLNQQFNLETHPLREKDVSIKLDRSEGREKMPVYLITFGFDIS